MEKNKKIKNAKETSYNNITFKSKLELAFYKKLKEEGLNPEYESTKFVLMEGFKPTIPFYNRRNKRKQFTLDMNKIRDITYTPDFIIFKNNTTYIIEAKGIENDAFPIKKKLFRKLLETMSNVYYFEVRTLKELQQLINLIKSHGISIK